MIFRKAVSCLASAGLFFGLVASADAQSFPGFSKPGHVIGNSTAAEKKPEDSALSDIIARAGGASSLGAGVIPYGTGGAGAAISLLNPSANGVPYWNGSSLLTAGALPTANGGLYGATANAIPYGGGAGTLPSFAAACASGLLTYTSGSVPVCAIAIPNGVTATTQGITDNSTKIETTAGTFAKLPFINFLLEGGDNTGSNPSLNAAAWANAVAALSASGGTIYFPRVATAGACYNFPGQVSYAPAGGNTPNHIRIVGDGPDASILCWPAADSTFGMAWTQSASGQSISIEDIGFTTSSANAAVGLTLNSSVCLSSGFPANYIAPNFFKNVVFRGDDYGQAHYWATAALINGLSNTNWDVLNVTGFSSFGGNGLVIEGNPSACGLIAGYSLWHNIKSSVFKDNGAGIEVLSFVQGVTVSDGTNFQNGTLGIFVPSNLNIEIGAATVATGGSGCTNGSQTFTISGGTGTSATFTGTVSGNSLSGSLTIVNPGNYSIVPSLTGNAVTGGGCSVAPTVNLTETNQLAQLNVHNSQFNTANDQIQINSPFVASSYVGNNITVPANHVGINLGSTAQANLFQTIIGNQLQGSSATGSVGISYQGQFGTIIGNTVDNLSLGINAGTPPNGNTVSANTCDSAGSPCISGGSVVVNNYGYNPVGASAAANVCASPCTITAGSSPETHFLKQTATNTATVTINSQQIATLASSSTYYPVELAPNQSMVVTWSTTTPTDTKVVH